MVARLVLIQAVQVQILMDHLQALLAELAYAPDLESGSWGFESLTGYNAGGTNWQSRLIQT